MTDADLQPCGSFVIDAAHPSLPGHFPGDPIVPGVVLLDAVLALAVPADHVPASLPAAKFVQPVRPGQTVAVAAAAALSGRIAFRASSEAGTVLHGTVALRRSPR